MKKRKKHAGASRVEKSATDMCADGPTYRTLKLGSLAAASLYDVFEADLGVTNLLLYPAGAGAGSPVPAAVAIDAIAVYIGVSVGSSVPVLGRPRPAILGVRSGGSASPAAPSVGRWAAPPRCA